jgi:hypothetical protein
MKRSPRTAAILAAVFFVGIFVSAGYAMATETERDGRFIAYDNGTVLDTKTNLIWAAKDNGNDISHTNAVSYCQNYRGGGYTDWRMPTRDELAGLYDRTKTNKSDCGEAHLTKLIRVTCDPVLASETRGSEAAVFDFFVGRWYWLKQSTILFQRVLPVRTAK